MEVTIPAVNTGFCMKHCTYVGLGILYKGLMFKLCKFFLFIQLRFVNLRGRSCEFRSNLREYCKINMKTAAIPVLYLLYLQKYPNHQVNRTRGTLTIYERESTSNSSLKIFFEASTAKWPLCATE